MPIKLEINKWQIILMTLFLKIRSYKFSITIELILSWWQSFWRLDLTNLYYDRIDITEGAEILKSNRSRECMICHYWFLNDAFKFQVWYALVAMICLSINNIAIITVKSIGYCRVIHSISNLEHSKSQAINLLKTSVLENRLFLLYAKWFIVNIVWTSKNL